jgi:hypothetical protein
MTAMAATGRPARFNAEIGMRILDRLTGGRSLRAACRDAGIPHSTVLEWISQDRDGFAARYREARQRGRGPTTCPTRYTEEIAERILQQLSDGRTLTEICADPGMPKVSTVRQWVAEDRGGFAARYRSIRDVIGNRAGRPTRYDDRVANVILDELCSGRSLASVCTDASMPAHATVRRWAAEDREGFGRRYEISRELGCDAIFHEILQIADGQDCWIPSPTPAGLSRE